MEERPDVSSQAQAITIFGGEDERSMELTVTPELLELLDLTALINQGSSERFHYSFSGLMIAFRYARHGISEWFREYLSLHSVDFAAILRYRNISEEDLRSRIESNKLPFADPNGMYPNGRRLATTSAFTWTALAKGFAQEQGHAWTGLRHMIGAIIFTPNLHAEDLERWRFDRLAWAQSYLAYVQGDLPDDLNFWRGVFERTFGPVSRELSQADIDRFSETVRIILERADQARKDEKKDRVYTEHLVFGLREPGSQLSRLAEATDTDLDVILKLDFGVWRSQPVEFHQLPPLSQNAVGALVAARDRADTDGSKIIEDTHLLFGVLSQTKSAIVQELNKRGITPDKVVFSAAVLPADTLAGYESDDPTGDDLMNITKDVNALASVLAATDVDPPLSLGIFGDWGSGKSFFMRRLEARIGKLQVDAKSAEGDSSYCQDIVQLTFNAWNYIDSDLWASLAAEIFEGLAAAIAEKRGGDSQQERALALAAASSAQTVLEEAERKRSRAEERLKQTEQRLASAQREAASIEANLSPLDLLEQAYRFAIEQEAVQKNLDAAAKELNISEGKAAAREIKTQILELHGIWNTLVFTMRNNENLWVWPAVSLLAVGASWFTIYLLKDHRGIPSLVTNLVALLVGASSFLAPFVRNARKALTFIQRARESKQKLIDEEKAKKTADLTKQQDNARKEVVEAQKAVESAEENLRALNDQLDKMRADRKLADYIRQRNESTDYTQRLGIIARVRADFRQLSTLLRDSRDETETEIKKRQKEKEKEGRRLFPRIDRIILYIDDLDRCPEKNVVEVLQAVHLLLAFPLFVVVVGVDPRWLLHSLGQQSTAFRAQQGGGETVNGLEEGLHWESTPMNYLEKIFQVPFTLRPINKVGFSRIVDAFTKSTGWIRVPGAAASAPIVPLGANSPAGTPKTEGLPTTEPAPPAYGSKVPDTPTKPSPIGGTAEPPPKAMGGAGAESIDRHPDHLRIEEWERSFMKELHELIPSPRAGKRFINIYRLLRASVEEHERTAFIGDAGRGDYQSALLLLAILTGYPAEATELLRVLIEEQPTELWWDFIDSLKERVEPDRLTGSSLKGPHQGDNLSTRGKGASVARESSSLEFSIPGSDPGQAGQLWSELFGKLEKIRPRVDDRSCDRFTIWAPRVARYSFQSGRVLLYQRD
jgi:hypothetical protein